MPDLTQARLKEILCYDLETGSFTWNHRAELSSYWNMKYAGKPAGYVQRVGKLAYLRIRIGRTMYSAHRLAFLYQVGRLPFDGVDHKNGDGLDNRWDNLREATQALNCKSQALRSNSTTGICGVTFDKANGKYQVSIKHRGKNTWGGRFTNLEDAAVKARSIYAELGFTPYHGLSREDRIAWSNRPRS